MTVVSCSSFLGICSAQSSCKDEAKNGLSVIREFDWRVVLVLSDLYGRGSILAVR
ncbi:hypothetical protein BYT27DRAFT_7183617 [Phlegmacium glaucopus]|nr:hypothetical protein BYT27DRAFT_7184414 [Phlegmacium glaucopus]KAF8811790.1 hypothetical protein BYT27DRAFT_7183617 [Phlegmacium glaucopus]